MSLKGSGSYFNSWRINDWLCPKWNKSLRVVSTVLYMCQENFKKTKGLHIYVPSISVRKCYKHLAGGGMEEGWGLYITHRIWPTKFHQSQYIEYIKDIMIILFGLFKSGSVHTLTTSSLASSLDVAHHASKLWTCLQAKCVAKEHNQNSNDHILHVL